MVGSALADGPHRHGRTGRRGGSRRGGRAFRRGRTEAVAAEPLGGYGAEAPPLDNYGAGTEVSALDAELAALSSNIPGVPGEDYPIFAEVPESEFSCDGQADGGKAAFLAPMIFHFNFSFRFRLLC